MSIFDTLKGMVKEKQEKEDASGRRVIEPELMGTPLNNSGGRERGPPRGIPLFSRDVDFNVGEFKNRRQVQEEIVNETESIKEAEQIVSANDTKQIKNFEEELKGMVRGSVDDPKKDSQLMEVVNSVGKGLTAGFEWTEGQWKNMTPSSKVTLISSLASAYLLSKGKTGAASSIAGAAVDHKRYNDKVSTARGKLENDRKEKAAEADAAYVKEKKSDLVATATNSAIKSIADSSLFIELTQVAGRIYGTNNMGEEDRIALANTLASEYRLQVQGGGITQGSFQDFASNPEVIKSVMQKYKTS